MPPPTVPRPDAQTPSTSIDYLDRSDLSGCSQNWVYSPLEETFLDLPSSFSGSYWQIGWQFDRKWEAQRWLDPIFQAARGWFGYRAMVDSHHSETTRPSLLLAVRDRDNQQAWADFVQLYGPKIARWCRGRGLQSSDVDDVTQRVLAKLVDKMQQFEYDPREGTFRGWLKRVTLNALADYARSEGRRLDVASGGSAVGKLLDTQAARDSLVNELEEPFQSTLLREAEARVQLRGIKQSTWRAFFLRAHKGLTSQQVAKELGMTTTAVDMAKSRVQRMVAEEVRNLEQESSNQTV